MAVEEEILRLVYEIKGQDQAAALESQLDRHKTKTAALKAELDELNDAYQRGAVHSENYLKQKRELEGSINREQQGYNRSLQVSRPVIDDDDDQVRRGANKGRALLELGRFTQDFQAAGIGGVLNNIEGATMALGLGTGLAGALTVAGVAASVAWPQIRAFLDQLGGGSYTIPKAANDIGGMKDQLQNAKKAMEELEARSGSLTGGELIKYNRLRAETAALEKRIADEQERQSVLKKILEAPSKEQEERARGVQSALQGRGREFERSLEQALMTPAERAALAKAQQDRDAAVKESTEKLAPEEVDSAVARINAEFERKQAAIRKGRDQQANRLLGDFGLGDATATAQVEGLMAQNPDLFNRETVRALRKNSPTGKKVEEARKKAEDELWKAFEADVDRTLDDIKREGVEQRKGNEIDRRLARSEVKPLNKAEDEAIEQSGIGTQAEALLAQIRAAGGVTDRFGNFRKLDEGQQFDYVQKQVAAHLHRQIGVDQFGRPVRANAGMGAEETWGLSTRITAGAQQDLGKRMAAQSGQQLSNTDKLIAVVGQLQNHAARQARQIDTLGSNMHLIHPTARSGRNRGRG